MATTRQIGTAGQVFFSYLLIAGIFTLSCRSSWIEQLLRIGRIFLATQVYIL